MKKTTIIIIIILAIIGVSFGIGYGLYSLMSNSNIENQIFNEEAIRPIISTSTATSSNNQFSTTEGINTAFTLVDRIQNNTVWCGTFQLIWNDLKNELAKQHIVFNPQLQSVTNLNRATFTVNDLSDKSYYKKVGTLSVDVKKEIEQAIKEKFNETSEILDNFDWQDGHSSSYFLYAMLKKEFQFEKAFEELPNGNFGNYTNVKYFGISKESDYSELRNQVQVLYYNSKDDFAIALQTKQEDEVILCKNPNGATFDEIYINIEDAQSKYVGRHSIEENELLKIPNIKLKELNEFKELEDKKFKFSDGTEYFISKAMQTIEFELDRTGGKIKSEAGMEAMLAAALEEPKEPREFAIDNTFAIFLKEQGKDTPYFAGKIEDITKFQ